MQRLTIALFAAAALLASPEARPEAAATTISEPDRRLTVSFLTAEFLAQLAARVVAERILEERTTGAHLQEKTGLIWTLNDNGEDLDWYAAGEYCSEHEVADWSDWRLPTIDELEGLHDKRSNQLFKLPDGFRLTACCPWSQTRSSEESAWNFSFRHRKRFSGDLNYSYELRALCVRSASPDDVEFFARIAEEDKKRKKRARGS